MEEKGILITVRGTPRSQPRPRVVGTGSARHAVSTLDPLARRWVAAVKCAAQGAFMDLGGAPVIAEILGHKGEPLQFCALFKLPTPKRERWGKYHSQDGRYDFDNLAKLALDAIWNCGISGMSGGDGRACVAGVVKVWCSPQDAGALFKLSRPLTESEAIARFIAGH